MDVEVVPLNEMLDSRPQLSLNEVCPQIEAHGSPMKQVRKFSAEAGARRMYIISSALQTPAIPQDAHAEWYIP
jgi:hypothetical protein